MRILYVDDYRDAATAVKIVLEHLGAEVETADGIGSARRSLGQRRFDLVLTEIELPDGNGCEFIRQIIDQYQVICIACTTRAFEPDRIRSLEAGCMEFLTKPVDYDVLRGMVHRVRKLVGPFSPSTTN